MTIVRRIPEEAGRYVEEGYWTDRLVDTHVSDAAAERPGGVAIVDRDRRVTNLAIEGMIARTAGLLAALGVRRGDVVSFQLPNWLEAAVVYHATVRIGAISNPILPIHRGHEVRFVLRQAQSRVLVIPDVFRRFDHRAMVAEMRDDLPSLEHVLVVGRPAEGATAFADAAARSTPAAAVERHAADPALLLYTSGTESDPKGVLHTHQTLDYECRSVIDLFGLTGADVLYMASPVTHITGLLYGLQLPFMLRSRVVLQDVWDAEAAVSLIERERCTFSVGATPFLHGLVNSGATMESLRVFACGGADVPPGLVRSAHAQGIVATRVYGSTECPIVTGTPPRAPVTRHAETDGAPISPSEVRIVGDDGRELADGVEGDVEVRGPDVCIGYLDASLNDRPFTPDGWFRTGDLAVRNEDGSIRITGRAKDVILRGGENLSAKEIEDLLFEHPDVEEVAVVGYPDDVLGERACAFVVAPSALRLEDVVPFLRERRVANQKLPEKLRVVEALPKTASGKIQKYRLRDLLRSDPP